MFDLNKDGKFSLDDLKVSIWGVPAYLLLAGAVAITYYIFGTKSGKKTFKF